ncbi:hypothetical protein EYZ11_011381 [Aspergillus tanneri]|uniref:Uncharacterized protein n=1 Tax=Aspergillus tanneri TaxID=1220188 RepID=A0A4V3UMY8_9EURO|nr:hypothetical protein EYZ11_011381 [Aspergillus tanneri]
MAIAGFGIFTCWWYLVYKLTIEADLGWDTMELLHQEKSVDLKLWESSIDEGNALRKEIKTIAAEYDTYWDEEKVHNRCIEGRTDAEERIQTGRRIHRKIAEVMIMIMMMTIKLVDVC